MRKLLSGTHHICLKSRDEAEYAQVLAFYRDILGMEVVRQGPRFAMLDTGDGTVMELSIGERNPTDGNISHFALRTEDVDACVAAVTAAGRPITNGPKDVVLPCEPPCRVRIAFTLGLLGESIEFFQEY